MSMLDSFDDEYKARIELAMAGVKVPERKSAHTRGELMQTKNEVTEVTKMPAPTLPWTPEQIKLLKNTVCRGATDDEFHLFCYAIKRTGLDPFMRQIYAVKRSNTMTIQTGIDGYRLIADRTGLYAGNDDAVFETDDEDRPLKALVTVHKMVAGQKCAFSASARWDEYYPGEKMGMMWKKMPHVMLAKCAESQALRKAFPAELSGIYTREEMEQADKPHTENVPEPIPVEASENKGNTTPSKSFGGAYRIDAMRQIVEIQNELGIDKDGLQKIVFEQTKKMSFKDLDLNDLAGVLEALKKEKQSWADFSNKNPA